MGRRSRGLIGLVKLTLLGLLLLGIALAAATLSPRPVRATHNCSDAGSPGGPFDILAYEAKEWRTTYARTLELAGLNQLFPDIPSFRPADIEVGPRSAGSTNLQAVNVPATVLKAIAWIESVWTQADWSVDYGKVGRPLLSHSCAYGIMQIVTSMENASGIPTLEQAMIGGHYAFNIARGVQILINKWNSAPEFRPIVGERQRNIIENWYYSVWGYNGFAFVNHPLNPFYPSWPRTPYSCGPLDDGFGHDRSQYPFQELVFGCATRPPRPEGGSLWDPVSVALPDLSNPAVADAFSLANWQACALNSDCASMDIATPTLSTTTTSALASPTPKPSSTAVSSHTSASSGLAAVTIDRNQVLGKPVLALSATELTLEAVSGSQSPATSLIISNEGSGPLVWRLSTPTVWLRFSRFQGVSLGDDGGPLPQTVAIFADTSGLPSGTYTGQLTIESLWAQGAFSTIKVTLKVLDTSPPQAGTAGDVDCDGTITSADAVLVLGFLAGLQPFAECVSTADINCDGAVDATDALTILRKVIDLPLNLQPGCQS